MADITKLKVANTHTENVIRRFEEAVTDCRKFLQEHPNAGFALVRYARNGMSEVHMEGDAYVYDPMDYFFLPEYAKEHIKRLRDMAQ